MKKEFYELTEFDNLTQYGNLHISSDNIKTTFQNILFIDIAIITETIVINYVNGSKTHPLRNHEDNKKKIIFKNCDFDKILFSGDLKHNYWFENCTFKSCFFQNITNDKTTNDYITFKECSIEEMNIKSSIFDTRFYINPKHKDHQDFTCKISTLCLEDSVFKKNCKVHDCEIKIFEMNNVDFEKNCDFFLTKFLQNKPIEFKAINFRGLALFGECEFYETLLLEYVTFEKLTHFREAIFKKGIDLEKTNIEKEINFYGVKGLEDKQSILKTSQESYRIIKYNFNKVGNTIEANKYHSYELEKRKNNLWKLPLKEKIKKWQELVVFEFHWRTSQHSRNWLLPLVWIFTVGFFTTIFNDINGLSHVKHICFTLSESHVDKLISEIIKYMSIFNIDDSLKNSPWLFLLNKAALGYMYYQFLTAIRKDTKK